MSIQTPRVLKGFAVFADGRGYAGRSAEAQLPKLTLKTEEHRDGGMDAPIELDMGMDKLEAVITFDGYEGDLLVLLGNDRSITLRGSKDGATFVDGRPVEEPIEVNVRGLIKEVDDGSWKAGMDKAQRKLSIAPRYYRYRENGRTLIEIDQLGGKRIIGGVDQLARRRQNLGI